MPELANVKVALLDADADLRASVRHMLRDLGLINIHDTERPRGVIKSLLDRDVDLLVCDIDQNNGLMRKTVRELRWRSLSDNPFPVTIALTSNKDHEHIRMAINAGFDSVVLKPTDLGTLRKRVSGFFEGRKPFVVTVDYVGPDRRQTERPGVSSAAMIEVPNPIKLVADGMTRRVLQAHVEETCEVLDKHHERCDLNGILWIAERLATSFAAGVSESDFISLAAQLKTCTANVSKRITNGQNETATNLCRDLTGISGRIFSDPMGVNPADTDRLITVTRSLKTALGQETAVIAPETIGFEVSTRTS